MTSVHGGRRLLLALILTLSPVVVSAQTVTLEWDPSIGATGYTVKWGSAIGSYPNSADAGANTTFDFPNLTPGATYWTVVLAYNATGTSAPSQPLQFTVTGPTPVCTYAITPIGVNAGAAGATGTITVTTPAGCAWSATSSNSFLTFQNGSGRSGPGTVTYTVDPNTATSSRIGMATVASNTFSVSQAAAACAYSISPASANVGAAANSGTITVTTQAGCSWSAASGSSFLTFSNGANRSGPGTVSYTVADNTATTSRNGSATVAGNAFAVTQAGAACTYSITPTTANVGASASSGTITVATQAGCSWSATSGSSFLTFSNGTGRSGPGTVSYTVADNTATTSRNGTATVAGNAFSVTQPGAACTYSISPPSTTVGAPQSSGTITVTTQAGCSWSAASGSSFLTFSNGTGRSGPGTVSYTVADNTATTSRNGTATVANNPFSVTQAGAACVYSISPASASVGAAANSGTIAVTTQAGCSWSAASGSSFLTFSNGANRSGPGTVSYTVADNTATTSRNGSATVAGNGFAVTQAGAACVYSISPATANVGAAASSSGTVTVTTQAGCSWSAASGSSFLTFSNGANRSGPGTVSYTVADNTATTSRNGSATVAGSAFAVTQAGAACVYSISPATANVGAAASSGTVTVTTQAGCSWSATSGSSFLTFSNGANRSGPGTVSYTVADNTATTSRNGGATVAGNAFALTQAGAACVYSISPTSANVSAVASSGTVTVTTQAGCSWSATSGSSFLTFQNGTGRSGPGTVSYTVAENVATTSRNGSATIATAAFAVSQGAAACTYSTTPTTASVGAPVSSGTITVTTQSGCSWSATSNSSFLTFQNGTGRSGPGTVGYTVAENTATTSRSGSATVASAAFAVSQAAAPAPCTYLISPASVSVLSAATTGTIDVTTGANCTWTATSGSSFLTFQNGTGRSGPGSVSYAIAANTSTLARNGSATVGGMPFAVSQGGVGATCSYSVTPTNINADSAGGPGTIDVTTQTACNWSASSISQFVTISNGTGRTGNGSVSYTVLPNATSSARTLILAVASKTVYITQSAPTAPPPPAGGSTWSSDFDGDGKNDLLVHDPVSGVVEAWFLDAATVKGTRALSHTMDANWMLVGRGDFNADGKPDVVWQHKTNGTIELWHMDGTNRLETATPSMSPIGDGQWRVVGVGDFNHDGKPDLAWQHPADGALVVWLMDGAAVTATVSLTPDRSDDVLWKVVGIADFNGDGDSDLLWRHMGDGRVGVWFMNGTSRTGLYTPLNPSFVPDQGWQVGAVMDANGDGKPDLVWAHTNRTIMFWHMNGTARTTFPTLAATVPVGWLVAGPK